VLSAAIGAVRNDAPSGSESHNSVAGSSSSSAPSHDIPIIAVASGSNENGSEMDGVEAGSTSGFPASLLLSVLDGSSNPLAGGGVGGSNGVQRELQRAENDTSGVLNGKAKETESEEEKKLAEIYENFDFEAIWERLSQVLTRLKRDPNAAQILLPLIEVSKRRGVTTILRC
jgi:hypothetical protein